MASQEDLAFGQIAVEKKFCTAAQVAECLEQQAKERELGVLPKSLAERLMEAGHLSQYLVKEIYKLQGKQEGFPEIEGYVIEAKIGHGGMGTVYRAVQQSLERPVAIKVLASNLARDREFVSRFMREARSVAALNHENIIVGIDVGKSNGHHFFAMEYVDGFTVHDMLRMDGPLNEAKALDIVRQMALALAHANEHHLVHRDVKPGNIMVVADGTAKLCDLGLAKSIHQDQDLTHTGTTHGTPHYMSPEQARGSADIDIRSDIYSLGATLYQMVVGEVPFTGASAAVVLLKHLSETVPSPRHRRPGLTDGVCHLIETMMAKKPEHRYQTPRELLSDIDRVLAGEAPQARRPGAGESSVMPASAPPEAAVTMADAPSDPAVDQAFDAGPAVSAEFAPARVKVKLILACGIAAMAGLLTLWVTSRAERVPPRKQPGEGPGATAVSVLPGTTWTAQPPPGPTTGPTPGPDAAQAAIEAQAAEWLGLLREGMAKYPDDFDAHIQACDALLKRFPETLAAQKARGIRSDLKARRNTAARTALDQVLAAQDGLLSTGEVGEAITQMAEVAELHAGTPAATEAEAHLRKLVELKIVRLADIRRAAGEAEDEEDYTTAIAHWKRALKLGDDDITAETRLQIERLEGLRRFAEAAAALRAQREGRNHLHNFVHALLQGTLRERRYRDALAELEAFGATAEAAPVAPRVQREVALLTQAADCFESAERALRERIGKEVGLRKRGVTDRLIAGQLRSFTDGMLKVQLGGTAGALVALPSRELALEDVLRLSGHTTDTADGRFAEAALRYADDDLPGARSALAAAAEAGMPVEQVGTDLDEFTAWRLLQAARRHWIAEEYRKAATALEQLQRRHGGSTLFADYEEEIRGRAALAPAYEERAEAVKLFRKAADPDLFGDAGDVAIVGEGESGPPHLELSIGGIAFGGTELPSWFLMAGDIDAEPWQGQDGGHSGPPRTSLLFEPRWLGDFPVRARVTFRASKAPSGVLFSLSAPFAGKGADHVPLRVVVGDEGSVLILQDAPHGENPANLLRLDGLKLADGESHTIDITLGAGRVSVSIDGSPVRSAPAASRKGGHLQLEGHGAKLRFEKIALTARLDPWWVLNDRKVRRLLTVRKR